MKKITLITIILSVLVLTNAQLNENKSFDTDTIPVIELVITPEIEKEVFDLVHWMHSNLSARSHPNIKKWSQQGTLELGKPIPSYRINNEKITFSESWHIPVLCDGKPLILINGLVAYNKFAPNGVSEAPLEEHIHNYEHKDLIIGSVVATTLDKGIDYLIFRKENKDVFVEVYDEISGLYFKNEYGFREMVNLEKERAKTEVQNRAQNSAKYLDYVADKSELIISFELEERMFRHFRNKSDIALSQFGIKDRAQLDNLKLGKPIPKYGLHSDSLQFAGSWEVPVMSDGVPFFMALIRLKDDGQYRYVGGGSGWAEAIHNYERKDLIIGFLGVGESVWGTDYLIIRKNGKDIFVKGYDWETREALKTEYSLSEIINFNKK
jgi:hypothetical protein